MGLLRFIVAKAACQYVDRGDVAAYDFTLSSFTIDSGWHDLDLSAICPTGTTLVLLRVWVKCNDAWKQVKFRTKGNANEINITVLKTLFGIDYWFYDVWVAPNTAGIIQYWFETADYDSLGVFVRGWLVE
jgi:hypothetical protein